PGGGTRGSQRSPTCWVGSRAMSGCIASAFTTTENTASAIAQPAWLAAARPTTPAPMTSTLATGRATGPPYRALGEANRNHTTTPAAPAATASSQPPASAPQTARAVITSSSSRNTSASTNQPRPGGTLTREAQAYGGRTEPLRQPTRGAAMSDKSPRQGMSKKSGKSIKEK